MGEFIIGSNILFVGRGPITGEAYKRETCNRQFTVS